MYFTQSSVSVLPSICMYPGPLLVNFSFLWASDGIPTSKLFGFILLRKETSEYKSCTQSFQDYSRREVLWISGSAIMNRKSVDTIILRHPNHTRSFDMVCISIPTILIVNCRPGPSWFLSSDVRDSSRGQILRSERAWTRDINNPHPSPWDSLRLQVSRR